MTDGALRRVVLGGVIGGLPGLLIILVPLSMHELGLITSDQSQIGFVGVPLLFVGIAGGTLLGVSETDLTISVLLGLTLGFVIGVAAGVAVDAALAAAGVDIAGIWLFLAAATMIAGAGLGVWWGERRRKVPPPPMREPHDQPNSNPPG